MGSISLLYARILLEMVSVEWGLAKYLVTWLCTLFPTLSMRRFGPCLVFLSGVVWLPSSSHLIFLLGSWHFGSRSLGHG